MKNSRTPLILGIDTSADRCSVGLAKGKSVLGDISLNAPREHSSLIIPSIDRLLKDNGLKVDDLEGIAVSQGPGCFTGLRVGVATAKTLAQALEIPIVGIPTLDAIALNAGISDQGSDARKGMICVIVDARRQQVYTARYSAKAKKLTKDLVLTIDELLNSFLPMTHDSRPASPAGGRTTVFTGNAIPVYGEIIKERMGERAVFAPQEHWYPRASIVALAGMEKLSRKKNGDALFKFKPTYVREPDIRKAKSS